MLVVSGELVLIFMIVPRGLAAHWAAQQNALVDAVVALLPNIPKPRSFESRSHTVSTHSDRAVEQEPW